MSELAGMTAPVTGAAQGIGAATARALTAAGAEVVGGRHSGSGFLGITGMLLPVHSLRCVCGA